MLQVSTGNRIIYVHLTYIFLFGIHSVSIEMSFQEDREVPSTSSTMLNLSTLLEPIVSTVGSSEETGMLNLGVKKLKKLITGEEKFDSNLQQSKKVGRKKSISKKEVERSIIKDELKMELDECDIDDDNNSLKCKNNNHDQELKIIKSNDAKELMIISLDEIAWHDTPDDCWFAIYDYVYDCTSFIRDHPGGDDVLLEYAGRDATLAFIGAGHSRNAQKILERYLIGELPPNERIFRVDGGVKVYGF